MEKFLDLYKIRKGLQIKEEELLNKYLKERWTYLSNVTKDTAKGITKETFNKYYNLPGIISERLFSCFDKDKDGFLNLKEFTIGMQSLFLFSKAESFNSLAKFIFNLYDFNSTGIIKRDDVRVVLSYMPDKVESQEKLFHIINIAFKDKEEMNYEEYINTIENVNSDIFILLLKFLLEKKPFSKYSFKSYYNDVICPKCKTTAIIDIDERDLNLKVLNCENFHCLNNIKYDQLNDFVFDFDDESIENETKLIENKDILICNSCNTHKKYMTPPEYEDDKLYACSCGAIVCSLCYEIHKHQENEKHYLINLDDKNYYCLKHGEKFNSYCFDCNANYCEECMFYHTGHEIEKFSNIKPKREEIKELDYKVDKQKEQLLRFIETTRKLFDDVINTIENYLNSYLMIERSLIRRYDRNELNYQLIRNLKNKKLFKNDIFNKLTKLDEIKKNDDKFYALFNTIYKPINFAIQNKQIKRNPVKLVQNWDNTMTMTYNIGGKKFDRRVKLFDPIFVENNKDKLSIVVNERPQKELSVYYQNVDDKNKIKVTLRQIKTKKDKNYKDIIVPLLTDMSYMFNNCIYLESVDFTHWKTENITSMEAMFQLCKFKNLPDVSKFSTSNLENIRAMFCKCKEIKGNLDMKNWSWFNNSKENNLNNISMLFNGCKNLTSITLPNNLKNMTKIEDISYMFNRCKNLREIHGLKTLKTPNVKNMCGLFNCCEKLASISVSFETPNVEDMSIMMQGCKALERWDNTFKDTKKVKDISGMFSGCENLKKNLYTGITNTDSLINMVGVFNKCKNIESLPDISKWNTTKVEKAKGLFSECTKLKVIPKNLNLWRFKKGTNYDEILEKCSLVDLGKLKNEWKRNEIQDIIQFN